MADRNTVLVLSCACDPRNAYNEPKKVKEKRGTLLNVHRWKGRVPVHPRHTLLCRWDSFDY